MTHPKGFLHMAKQWDHTHATQLFSSLLLPNFNLGLWGKTGHYSMFFSSNRMLHIHPAAKMCTCWLHSTATVSICWPLGAVQLNLSSSVGPLEMLRGALLTGSVFTSVKNLFADFTVNEFTQKLKMPVITKDQWPGHTQWEWSKTAFWHLYWKSHLKLIGNLIIIICILARKNFLWGGGGVLLISLLIWEERVRVVWSTWRDACVRNTALAEDFGVPGYLQKSPKLVAKFVTFWGKKQLGGGGSHGHIVNKTACPQW